MNKETYEAGVLESHILPADAIGTIACPRLMFAAETGGGKADEGGGAEPEKEKPSEKNSSQEVVWPCNVHSPAIQVRKGVKICATCGQP